MPRAKLPVIYLDLDRTLFKTKSFISNVWRTIEQANDGIDASFELSRLLDFYIVSEGYRDYNFSAHLENVNLSVKQTYDYILHRLKNKDFEYSGVGNLLRRLNELGLTVKIFTYGRADFQKLKFDLSPSLAGCELIVTLEPKEKFFEELGRSAVLLDDKPISQSVSEKIKFIQSVGYNGVEPPKEHDWQTASSLEEFGDIIEEMIGGDKNI